MRAGNAESVNADAIAAETLRAGNAETVNADAIADEATARVDTDATHTIDIANNASGVVSNSANIAVNALSIQDNETALGLITSAVTVTSPGVTTIRAAGSSKVDEAHVSVGANWAMLGAATTDGENMVVVDKSSARVVFRNNAGNEHGLVVSADSTTLTSGGDEATTIRMDADGVTFEHFEASATSSQKGASVASSHGGSTGAPVQLHGVAAGTAETDAANVGQLSAIKDQLSANEDRVQVIEQDAYRGIAIANAMEVFLPDPGRQFRLNFGMGYYKDQAAMGVTGSGRLTDDIGLYIGAGSDSSFKEVGGKAGVSFQW